MTPWSSELAVANHSYHAETLRDDSLATSHHGYRGATRRAPLTFLDVARSPSDARPDFRSVRAKRVLRGDPPAGGPGKGGRATSRMKEGPRSVTLTLPYQINIGQG
eukprot:1185816-Prorocentrum_minimum.AAC.1